MYGDKIVTEYGRKHGRQNDVIGEVTTAPAGNLVLRVGRLLENGTGWEGTGHIVMTPDEVEDFMSEVSAALEGVAV